MPVQYGQSLVKRLSYRSRENDRRKFKTKLFSATYEMSRVASLGVFAVLLVEIYSIPNNPNEVSVDKCFKKYDNKLLSGFARKTLRTSSVDDCLRKCLERVFEFEDFLCKSILYYEPVKNAVLDSDNCVLNSETKDSQADMFAPAVDKNELVTYYDNLCAPVRYAGMDDTNVAVVNVSSVYTKKMIGYISINQKVGQNEKTYASAFFANLTPSVEYSLEWTSKCGFSPVGTAASLQDVTFGPFLTIASSNDGSAVKNPEDVSSFKLNDGNSECRGIGVFLTGSKELVGFGSIKRLEPWSAGVVSRASGVFIVMTCIVTVFMSRG